MFAPEDYLDLDRTEHRELFKTGEPVWAALTEVGEYLIAKLESCRGSLQHGKIDQRAIVGSEVYLGAGSVVEANAVIKGPAWIGENCTVRSGAYLRENVIAGNGVMLGNSCEFKHCLIFDGCEIPHFNYVGDSILGHKAHLGAGVICSNVRLDRQPIAVKSGTAERIDTGLQKFGAIVGDGTEIGCNSVLSPGSILGRGCIVHPCTHWHGVLPGGKIVRNAGGFEIVDRS